MPDLSALGFSPFIYHGQRIHRARSAAESRPFLDSCFALWRLHEGAMTVSVQGDQAGEQRVHGQGIALTEPGDRVRLGTGVRVHLVVFDIVHRPRSAPDKGQTWLVPKQGRQPAWTDIFGHVQPTAVPAHWQRRTALLVDHVCESYWVDAYARCEAQQRLGLWLVQYARFLGNPLRISAPDANAGAEDPLVAQAVAFIHAHYDRPITVADVAERHGISREHLIRRMRGRGVTPGHLLNELRMAKARELLESEHTPIGDIPPEVGYRSSSAFSAAFKRVIGMSPKQYRQMVRA